MQRGSKRQKDGFKNLENVGGFRSKKRRTLRKSLLNKDCPMQDSFTSIYYIKLSKKSHHNIDTNYILLFG